jgi:hypothetical protein
MHREEERKQIMSKAYDNAVETCRRLGELEIIARANGNKNMAIIYKAMHIGALAATLSITEGPAPYMKLKLPEDSCNYLEQLNKGGYDV